MKQKEKDEEQSISYTSHTRDRVIPIGQILNVPEPTSPLINNYGVAHGASDTPHRPLQGSTETASIVGN